jgi:hypothetical protein
MSPEVALNGHPGQRVPRRFRSEADIARRARAPAPLCHSVICHYANGEPIYRGRTVERPRALI